METLSKLLKSDRSAENCNAYVDSPQRECGYSRFKSNNKGDYRISGIPLLIFSSLCGLSITYTIYNLMHGNIDSAAFDGVLSGFFGGLSTIQIARLFGHSNK